MKKIKLLPDNLINQIAAGEVIDRPASVVKELVENSIDAGAKRLEIEVSQCCRNIRVADNGHGIDKDDIEAAFSRHATSKIQSQEDLWRISTLGFRGEALASIISVSKVICTTKTQESETGLRVECENSTIKFSEVACATGTVMEIKDLFYNTPARLKFLKKPQTELSLITEIIQSIAISSSDIAVTFIYNKNNLVKTTGSNNLLTVISEIYSKDLINELCEVSNQDKPFKLEIKGLVSSSDYTRSNKKGIYIFINNRTIKCPIVSKAIDIAYKDLIPSERYPLAVINILMPFSDIDVNAHPTKKEVRYINPNLIFNFVYSSIKIALEKSTNKHSSDLEYEKSTLEIDSDTQKSYSEKPNTNKTINFYEFVNKFNEKNTEIPYDDIQEVIYNEPIQAKIDLSVNQESQISVNKPKIIGQSGYTYILVDTDEGLQIIDQHIAHERYLYEKLKNEKNHSSQLLLTSEIVEIDSEQLSVLQENFIILSKLGYELELFPMEGYSRTLNNNAVALQAPIEKKVKINTDFGVKLKRVPQIVSDKSPSKVINDLIEALNSSPDILEDEIIMRTACSASVKAGEKLSFCQMEQLVIDWQNTKFPKTCPHGRKISHIISKKELANFFNRIDNSQH